MQKIQFINFFFQKIIMYSDQGSVIRDYELIKGIGQGNFSQVYKAVKKKQNQNQYYAIKVIDKRKLKTSTQLDATKNYLKTQIQVMSNVNSDFVIKLYQTIQKDQKYYLVMQYCSKGSLEQYIQKTGRVEQVESIAIFKQILCGILSLHSINVTHRDLKPANILKREGRYKIGDLGFSRFLIQLDQSVYTVLGTPDYMAPQIIKGHPYTRKSDIWSLGIILYRMVYGQLPYNYKTSDRKYMMETLQNTSVKYALNISQPLINLIKSCLVIDPNQRINWNNLMQYNILRSDSYIQILKNIALVDIQQISQSFLKKIQSFNNHIQNKKIEGILDQYPNIEKMIKQYESYSKIILPEKVKLLVLLENVIKSKSGINQKFEQSRRLLQLRLLIASQCMVNCQYYLKIYDNENKLKPAENLLKFEYFNQYTQSYQYKVIRDDLKFIYRQCSKCYSDISNKLFQIQDKISQRIKDKLKQIFNSEKTKEKQLMLQGIPSIDYQEKDHINFTIRFLKDPEIGIQEKLIKRIPPTIEVYYFAVALALYRRLSTKSDKYNQETVKILNQKMRKGNHIKNLQELKSLIQSQLMSIQ